MPPFPGVTRTGRGERHGGGSERITAKECQVDPMNAHSVLADLEPLLILKGGAATRIEEVEAAATEMGTKVVATKGSEGVASR